VRIRAAEALRNAHPTPDRGFLIEPEEILAALRRAEETGAGLVGFWHGHLVGGPFPGERDESDFLAFAEGQNGAWARALVVVGRGAAGRPVLRAYVRSRTGLREVPLRS
jgi:proteasome lid subunit RPN8/RPN11